MLAFAMSGYWRNVANASQSFADRAVDNFPRISSSRKLFPNLPNHLPPARIFLRHNSSPPLPPDATIPPP